MSVFDSIISGMRFNPQDDDDDMDDEELEDGEDYEEEDVQPKRRPSFGGGRGRGGSKNDDSDADSNEGQHVQLPTAGRSARRGGGSGSMQVRIIKPSSFDQAKQITDTLLSGRTVLLNLEGLDVNTAQRIVDFASGSCYALHGNFMKISHFIIVITPENVDISGDINMEGGDSMGALGALGALSQASGFDANANPFTQNLSSPYQQ